MEEIRIEYVDFEVVKKWPRNPKDHDLEEIKKSFDRFGFIKPILLDEGTGLLVAGHGRLETLDLVKKNKGKKPKGIKEVEGKWLLPVLRGVEFKDRDEAEAFLIADNRLSEIGGWDRDLLDEILAGMTSEEDLIGTGFTLDDVPDLENLGDLPELGSKDKKNLIACPKCGFEYAKK